MMKKYGAAVDRRAPPVTPMPPPKLLSLGQVAGALGVGSTCNMKQDCIYETTHLLTYHLGTAPTLRIECVSEPTQQIII